MKNADRRALLALNLFIVVGLLTVAAFFAAALILVPR